MKSPANMNFEKELDPLISIKLSWEFNRKREREREREREENLCFDLKERQ